MRRPMDILLSKGCGNEEKMSVIEKIFGTHSSRELKRIEPLVDKIEALRPTMQALSDEELRGKTEEYKKRLTEGETLASGGVCNRKRGCKACSEHGALQSTADRWYHPASGTYRRDAYR